MSVWDDPDLRAGGEFVKLEAKGDSVEGLITAVRSHRFDDGSVAPQILLTTPDGEEKTWTAGQIQAKRKLAELRPEAGDYIKATLTDVERRSGGKTLKHIDIEVRRAGRSGAGTPAAAGAPPATPGAAIQPAPAGVDPAQWATIDDSRRAGVLAALGLAGDVQSPGPAPF